MKKCINGLKGFTGNKTIKKVCRYTSNVIIAVLIVLVGFSVYGNMQTKGRNWVAPQLGPYRWLTVLSGSMEPILYPGDLIIDKKVDTSELKVGDIVTYMYGDNFLATHRVIEVNKDSNSFKTKGDNNNAPDETNVPAKMIVGKYMFRIPYLGFAIQKLKGLTGIVCIWILFLYVVGSEIYKYIKSCKLQKK